MTAGQQNAAALLVTLGRWRQADELRGVAPTKTTTSAYAEKGLRAECRDLANAGPGDRNTTLNRAAYSVAQLVSAGHLDLGRAVRELRGAAAACGLGEAEVDDVLGRAIPAGLKVPRQVPASAGPAPADAPPSPPPAVLTAAELLAMEISEAPCILGRTLPVGLAILAGAPKSRKSWWALQASLAVVTGGQVFGEPTVQGDVLYLALEDTKRRLQDRIFKLAGRPPYTEQQTRDLSRLSLIFCDEHFKPGDLSPIKAWLERVGDQARLVVIDTHGRFAHAKPQDGDTFHRDYQAMAELKVLADTHGFCLLLIHHTRKAIDPDDPLRDVAGSTANTGAADAVLVLRRSRGEDDATFHVTGRDFDERSENATWKDFVWRTGGEGHQATSGKGRKKSPKLDACVAWLEGVLKGGPMKVHDVRRLNDAADGPNFGQTLLYAARDVMKLRDYKVMNRPTWALPGGEEVS